MPKTPVNHIHRRAPGPPIAIADATPTILPVPIVAANAVVNAANCDISPFPPSFETGSLIPNPINRWINFNLIVK